MQRINSLSSLINFDTNKRSDSEHTEIILKINRHGAISKPVKKNEIEPIDQARLRTKEQINQRKERLNALKQARRK